MARSPPCSIREYDPATDREPLRACVVELQESERRIEPGLPAGETMADDYLAILFRQCTKFDGKVFVAEIDLPGGPTVAGFVGVLPSIVPEAPDEDQTRYGYVSDLVVLAPYRQRGIGRALLDHAEAFVQNAGSSILRLTVFRKNRVASELYRKMGFADYQVQMAKKLR